ncbi:hypothetical protein [Microbacterium sp.]|uniref:zinc finger domain-containing protein n=1 Tax=Microbacterium sp. TaxID=51671 RepID=UPI00333FD54F
MTTIRDAGTVFLDDPHGVACPTCGARALEACRWRTPYHEMTVHARRQDRWFRLVAPVIRAQEWADYPEDETLDALADRRALMRRRYCQQRQITGFLLRMHDLTPALLDCVPCGEQRDKEGNDNAN